MQAIHQQGGPQGSISRHAGAGLLLLLTMGDLSPKKRKDAPRVLCLMVPRTRKEHQSFTISLIPGEGVWGWGDDPDPSQELL